MLAAIAILCVLPAGLPPAPLGLPARTACQQPATGQGTTIANRKLREWYDEMEAVFADEDAVRQGREWLEKSLAFHGWDLFQEAGGLKMEVYFEESRLRQDGSRHVMIKGIGDLWLMSDGKGVYRGHVPKGLGMGRSEVRFVYDGETAWTHADGRDNHQAEVERRAFGRLQRERFLCGLPFAFADPGVELAALGESAVILPGPEGDVEHKTWRVRIRLKRALPLGLWTFGGDPEPVRIFHAEFYQDTFQLAAIDYFMFRSGRLDFQSPWFEYRHEFSREWSDDDFHVPAVRFTDLDIEGKRGRQQWQREVEPVPAPDEYFVRGWEILPELPDPFGGAEPQGDGGG